VSAPEFPTGGRPRRREKTGGRGPGTPNKRTALLREKLIALDYDPVADLVEIARDRKTALDLRVHIHLGLLPYLYPKRKPAEELMEESMTINVITALDDGGEVSNARGDALPQTSA
jgi:hypothetical protein